MPVRCGGSVKPSTRDARARARGGARCSASVSLSAPLAGLVVRATTQRARGDRLESRHEFGLLGGGKARLRVERQVEARGHLTVLELLRRILRVPLRTVPLAEVEVLAPVVHVLLDQPRERSDLAVPRPPRL